MEVEVNKLADKVRKAVNVRKGELRKVLDVNHDTMYRLNLKF